MRTLTCVLAMARVLDSGRVRIAPIALARYIDQNPVRASLCATPEQWPWSGCASTLGLRELPSFFDPRDVLAYFSSDQASARVAYALSLQDASRPLPLGQVRSPGHGTRPG